MTDIHFLKPVEDAWDHLLAHDRPQLEAIDAVLNRIEGDDPTLRVRMYDNSARFVMVPVPGRDQDSVVIWTMEDGEAIIHHIGRPNL
jgi:hypothetical protein